MGLPDYRAQDNRAQANRAMNSLVAECPLPLPPRTDTAGLSTDRYQGFAPPLQGRKDDRDKLDMTLFDDLPRALEAVAEVMQWAITKKLPIPYERGSWLGVSPDRYRAAIKRHDSAAAKQGTPRLGTDKETGLLHLAHMACSALFALELTLREIESDAE